MSDNTSVSRGAWASRSTFILASIGSAVGLGNAWRFPALCARHGGGTFLFVYILAILVMGLPLLMMEIAIGRKMRGGAVTALGGLNRKFEPIGWAATSNAFFIATYYAAVFGWVILMMLGSWKFVGLTGNPDAAGTMWSTAIKTTGTTSGYTTISWAALGCILLAWAAIWLCIRKGTDTINKVAKYTVMLPVACLLIMAAKGVTMPNASVGLYQLFVPNFAELADPQLWIDAFSQVFYSLSVMMAIMFAYGSFLDRGSNVAVDATIIAMADLFISILASVVMFTTLYGTGHAADVAKLGMGTTFTVYPMAIVSLTNSGVINAIFGFIFFFCLFTLALGSAFSIIEGVSTAFADKFRLPKAKCTMIICCVAGVISLFFTCGAGLAWLDVVDNWCNSFNLILVGVLETLAIGWGFKTVKVLKEINRNTKKFHMPRWWFDTSVKVIAPLLLSIFFVWNLVTLFQSGGIYGAKDGYSLLSNLVGGWGMMAVVFLSGFIIRLVIRHKAKNGYVEPHTAWDDTEE